VDIVESKLHRLSFHQLKALSLLGETPSGIISSTASGKDIGVTGKALGGVFSSLSRQRIGGEPLVIAFGKSADGRGLRWKLNTAVISIEKLRKVVKELVESWEEGQ